MSDPGYDRAWWHDARKRLTVDSLRDLLPAVEEIAAADVPGPLHSGMIQPAAVLRQLGATLDDRRHAYCLTEPDGSYHPDAVATRARQGRLNGVKSFVPYAADAEVLLVVARTDDGHGVFAVDADAPGVRMRPFPTIGRDRQCEIHLDDAPATQCLGTDLWPALEHAHTRSVVALAADQLGAAEAALRHTVARVTTRTQFGAPIGGLQAVKQRCADMYLDVTLARGVVEHAADLVDRGSPEAPTAAATAKVVAAERCRRVTASAHQLCGGQGILENQPLHRWYRRVKAAEPVLGGPRHHRATVATAVFRTIH